LVNKGFIIWDKENQKKIFALGTQSVIPSGKDNAILPARVANHSAGFGLSFPLTEIQLSEYDNFPQFLLHCILLKCFAVPCINIGRPKNVVVVVAAVQIVMLLN